MFEKTGVPVYTCIEIWLAVPGVDSGRPPWRERWSARKEATIEGFRYPTIEGFRYLRIYIGPMEGKLVRDI